MQKLFSAAVFCILRSSTIAGPVQPEVVEEAKAKYQSIVGEEAEILVWKRNLFNTVVSRGIILEYILCYHYDCRMLV